MAWTLLLYACVTSRGRGYEFDILAPRDMAAGRRIRSAGLGAPSWFAGRFGDRAFFGGRDMVGKYLGWDHPAARDRSRNLEFTLAYLGPAKATLPAWTEIAALRPQFAADLQAAVDLAMAASRPLSREVAAHPPHFDGPRRDEAAQGWDALVTQLSSGQDGIVQAGSDGAARLTRWDAAETRPPARRGEPDLAATEAFERDRGCIPRIAGLGMFVALLGAASAAGLFFAHPIGKHAPASEDR